MVIKEKRNNNTSQS